ncbi:MAG: aminotransferase class I/II-fold pyridoxal phosphate-dependent enzyme [Gammaproteobacteria bacterium]|nr:aminotransferase class I/II-fold pyridoxal phosphate-dependent enzyme [Gammaproteobacteria bacterium]
MTTPQFLPPAVHINLNVRGLEPSPTVSINERSKALRTAGRQVYALGLGQSPFPVPDIVQQALRAHAGEKDYLPVRGLPALREAIVDYYRRTQALDYSPEHVLVGPGTKELMFLTQLTYYGDLLIPSPSWVSYAPQARIIGRNLVWLPTAIESGLGVTPEALDRVCSADPDRPRLLIINYPGNPTGMVYSPEQLAAIAAVARRYRVLVLSDEIYGGLNFTGDHVSIARYYPEGTIISNGLSKWCGAGGWRLGAFVFPATLAWLHGALVAVASETYTSTSAPIQYAAVTGFGAHAEIEDYLDRSRAILAALCGHAWARLEATGAELTRPKGGFYLFPNFEPLRARLAARGLADGATLCERLLEETGVAVLPGTCFGRPPEELSLRLACVDFDGSAALAAAATTGDIDEAFLHRWCAPVMTAVERLCEWVAR